ncbi:unnamed protein product [Chrysoparadoxa australica]
MCCTGCVSCDLLALIMVASQRAQGNAAKKVDFDDLTAIAGERLYAQAMDSQRQLQKRASDYIPEECTFRPKLTEAWKKSDAERGTRAAKLERERPVQERAPSCSAFMPKPAARSRVEALYEDAKRRNAKMELAREAEEEAARRAAQPVLASRSSASGSTTSGGQPIMARLGESTVAWLERQEELKAKKLAAELEGCTFQPKINADTRAPGKFSDRMKDYLARREERIAALAKEMSREETFQPSIPSKSSSTAAPVSSVFSRLSERQEPAAALTTNQELAECTFQPRATKAAKAVAVTDALKSSGNTSTYQRLHDEFKQKEEERRLMAEERARHELAECSFQPNIPPPPPPRAVKKPAAPASTSAPIGPKRSTSTTSTVPGDLFPSDANLETEPEAPLER